MNIKNERKKKENEMTKRKKRKLACSEMLVKKLHVRMIVNHITLATRLIHEAKTK